MPGYTQHSALRTQHYFLTITITHPRIPVSRFTPRITYVHTMNDIIYIHPTADVSPRATLGPGTKVWHHAQVRDARWQGATQTAG